MAGRSQQQKFNVFFEEKLTKIVLEHLCYLDKGSRLKSIDRQAVLIETKQRPNYDQE